MNLHPKNISKRFFNNPDISLKSNHFLSNLDISIKIFVSNVGIEITQSQKFLVSEFIWKLKFHNHFSNLYEKASAKMFAMTKVFHFMLLNQGKLIMKDFLCPILITACYYG